MIQTNKQNVLFLTCFTYCAWMVIKKMWYAVMKWWKHILVAQIFLNGRSCFYAQMSSARILLLMTYPFSWVRRKRNSGSGKCKKVDPRKTLHVHYVQVIVTYAIQSITIHHKKYLHHLKFFNRLSIFIWVSFFCYMFCSDWCCTVDLVCVKTTRFWFCTVGM